MSEKDLSSEYKKAVEEVSHDLKGLEEVCDVVAEGIHSLPIDTSTKLQIARNLRDKYTEMGEDYREELKNAVRYQLVRDFYKVLENPYEARMGEIYAVNDTESVWKAIEKRVADRIKQLESDNDE